MPTRKLHAFFTILLVIALCASSLSVRSAHADGETPTEPPAPTQVATEPPTESPTEPPVTSTPEPVEATQEPVEATATPLAEILTQVPDSTNVVVLDENGNSVPLTTQEAAEIAQGTDPMWCPEGVLPGGTGCSTGFPTISALINNMVSNTSFYTQNGVIYFTADPGTGTFNLSPTTLTGDFDTLKNHNLTLQGGWNGDSVSPAFSGQTDFSSHPITIGSSGNPWVGNILINDITFTGASQTSLTVYTTTGNITLNNVDVNNQAGGHNTALLNTDSGNITVSEGTFDGNNTNSAGFSASTGSGSIAINDSSFTENKKSGASNNSNGATLSASTVTLTNVTATGNDGNGISINNADIVTLNNVVASNNGTNPPGPVNNIGSGVFVDGNLGSTVFINGGTFNSNKVYGIELAIPANTTIYVQSAPLCTGNISGCYNDAIVADDTAPMITPNVSGTVGSNGWYTSDAAVSWLVADAESGILSSIGCAAANLTSDTTGTTLTCSATNNIGLSSSASVTIKIDKTAPVLSLPADITTVASGPTVVNYSASATDNFDPSASANCSPISGTTFSLGITTVNCFSTDEAGNMSLGSFQVTVTDTTIVPTPTSTGSTSGASATNPSNSSLLIIPVTGGKVIDLGCDSAFWAFGIKLSFMSLCDYQTTLDSVDIKDLPGILPNGYSFVMGLNLSILSGGKVIDELPSGTSIQLDFPMLSGSRDQFAVLTWNGSEWIEVPPQSSDDPGFYRVITTNQTGLFILVKK